MPATSAPYGFRAVRHPSGLVRSNPYAIATGYAANIFKGDPVKLVTASGTISLATTDGARASSTAADLIGIFAGVEYTDANGKRVVSSFWPTGTTATNIVAWVWDDPATVFEVQGNGTAYVQADIGDQVDSVLTNGTGSAGGSTLTGLSLASTGTVVGAGSQGQFRIVALAPAIDNAFGDAYVSVQVQIARSQYVANKTAI